MLHETRNVFKLLFLQKSFRHNNGVFGNDYGGGGGDGSG